MTIQSLIDKLDNFELIEDQIAQIILTEVASQKALAVTANKDPRLWDLRVFLNRSNPWEEFRDDEPEKLDERPIINVNLENMTYPEAKGNVIERQMVTGLYNIDCYGYGKSIDAFASGHNAGDRLAKEEAMRAVRLVRNILMSSGYTYLGERGIVGKRWIDSVTFFQPQIGAQVVQQISAARIVLRVEFNEESPQYVAETLNEVAISIKRSETGEVYLNFDYNYS